MMLAPGWIFGLHIFPFTENNSERTTLTSTTPMVNDSITDTLRVALVNRVKYHTNANIHDL